MALSVNLRGDLAKLSDAELAERLSAAWRDYGTAERSPKWSWVLMSSRGPVQHPRAYRFFSLLQGFGSSLTELLMAAIFSGKAFEPLMRGDRASDMHLSLCEIKDVNDEIRRRVKQRKATK